MPAPGRHSIRRSAALCNTPLREDIKQKTPKRKLRGFAGLFSHVGQQSDLTSALDSGGQVTLVSCAGAGGTAGQDLATLGQVTAELCSIVVIDSGHLVGTEGSYLLALTGTHTLFVSHGITSFVSL